VSSERNGVLLVLEPDPKNAELLAALERSGMRRTKCEGCGCELLTRSASNLCPPCRDTARPTGRCCCRNYCNALRAGGFAGPLCIPCAAAAITVRPWGAGLS